MIYCDFKDRSELSIPGNTELKRPATKTSECIAWLKFLVNSIGDQQPDSGKVQLPYQKFAKTEILYQLFATTAEACNIQYLCMLRFQLMKQKAVIETIYSLARCPLFSTLSSITQITCNQG
jgi:hypothetical protein